MSKLLLYTVQGSNDHPTDSVADERGLTKYLGYRPIFCTPLDPDSLSESWFRIWAAAPRYPENIYIFEMDESECIPMNSVDWTNICLSKDDPSDDELKSVLNDLHPDMTDYLIKELPEDPFKISIPMCLTINFAEMLRLSQADVARDIFADVQNSIMEALNKRTFYSSISGRRMSTVSYDSMYGMIRMSGIITVFWTLATLKSGSAVAFHIKPEDLWKTTPFLRAQGLLAIWDQKIGTETAFTYDEYREMHANFIKALDLAASNVWNIPFHVGANDPCPCGSGKKYKKCCKNIRLDELMTVPLIETTSGSAT